MLDFYDELRRREQTLDDFQRLAVGRLAPTAEVDRGAERLLRQTKFLCAAYAAFQRYSDQTGRIDEHGLRAVLLDPEATSQSVYQHVIVTTADQAADPRGLYASDFGLLTLMSGLVRIDVIATESLLASGFHERVHDLLPGIEEERVGEPSRLPALIVPESEDPGERWFACRDREEELVQMVRWLRHRGASGHEAVRPPPLDRLGIVFQRPLPYLYLARQVFQDGGLPYQTLDALPLSGEPFAAAIDIVFSFLASEANRASAIELLRCPHLRFADMLSGRGIAAVDGLLRDIKYAGGWERLDKVRGSEGPRPAVAQPFGACEISANSQLPTSNSQRDSLGIGNWELGVDTFFHEPFKAAISDGPHAHVSGDESAATGVDRALGYLREAAAALRPVLTSSTASGQIEALLGFFREFERLPTSGDGWAGRHLRARSAVLGSLVALGEAHARHDDEPLEVVELSGSVRRWIEAQTFAPRTGSEGVRLLDAASAPYSELDELRIVGLVEGDWPEPVRRNIFYPASMLASMGWPADASRMAAARARFHDLLTAAGWRVSVSTFTLEEDAIVPGSPFLEEMETAGLEVERWPATPATRVFAHELLELDVAAGSAGAAGWLAIRRSRTSPADPRFKGFTGGRTPQTYAISYLERYLECPFKYLAKQVLRLPEERDEESGLTPIERGHFIHDVFETFFREWQAAGQGTITTANVADALEHFELVADRRLDALPEADRALERTHLLGSAAASGLAERAFAFEIEQGGQVIERLLEHTLEGEYSVAGADGPRRVRIKAKADRIDLMADGSLRIIDYKLGRAPKQSRALQLPIYSVIAEQELKGYRGRTWSVANAGYVAFKEKEAFVPLGGKAAALGEAIAEGQQRMLGAIEGIERGEFPVQPDEPFRCQWCGYAGVCRKDYVGDE
jgi:RecB family exonuclease